MKRGNQNYLRAYLLQLMALQNLRALIEGCLKNNHGDQKALYERYYGYCLKTVFRYIYRYDKAVDVVNDGYVKVFRSIHKFDHHNKENVEMIFMGWLRTIMINTAIDELRRNSFMPEIGAIPEEVWNIQDKSSASDQTILFKELIREIKKLPPSYRLVFNLYVIDGYTHQEIANKIGISVGTSKSNLSKARGLLQSYIKKNQEEVVCNL